MIELLLGVIAGALVSGVLELYAIASELLDIKLELRHLKDARR